MVFSHRGWNSSFSYRDMRYSSSTYAYQFVFVSVALMWWFVYKLNYAYSFETFLVSMSNYTVNIKIWIRYRNKIYRHMETYCVCLNIMNYLTAYRTPMNTHFNFRKLQNNVYITYWASLRYPRITYTPEISLLQAQIKTVHRFHKHHYTDSCLICIIKRLLQPFHKRR